MLGSVSPKPSKPKNVAVKGILTDITDNEFEEFLDLYKIAYAKAGRLKSKKDGRVLPVFRLEINDPTEAEALISQNLVCQVIGIVYEVEEFCSPVSVKQCCNCQSFGHLAKTCRSKDAQIEKRKNQNVLIILGHLLHLTEGVLNTKNAFRQHLDNNQKTYASVVSQNTRQQPKNLTETFSFTAEQLTKFIANVIIQIAQPQVYLLPKPKTRHTRLKV